MSIRMIAVIVAMTVWPFAIDPSMQPSSDDATVRACARVAETFLKLEDEASQLTDSGWDDVARLFHQPGAPRTKNVAVVKDLTVVSPAALQPDGRVHVMIEYVYLEGRWRSMGRPTTTGREV